jgi:hypothetical protein
MTITSRWVSGIALVLWMLVASVSVVVGQATHVRWDISQFVPPNNVHAGGMASALAEDGSEIRLTGSGTFVAPSGGGGTSSAATGGGTWETLPTADAMTPTESGMYEVVGLVRWEEAPGTFPSMNRDNIGDPADAHAGLAVLRIHYSDGSRGILVVGCRFLDSPAPLFEGVTASKGFVDYWNRVPPAGPDDNFANRTLFHVQ